MDLCNPDDIKVENGTFYNQVVMRAKVRTQASCQCPLVPEMDTLKGV